MWADKKLIKLECQGTTLRNIVSGMKFAASGVKRKQKLRMKYSYEKDKINTENNMNCSKKVLKKCLKAFGKAIHTTSLNDGRMNIEETLVFF